MIGASGTSADSPPVLAELGRHGLVVVIRSPTSADALRVGRVLLEAGAQVLEVTGTTPDAAAVLTALRSEAGPQVLLGIGSIRCTDDVRRAEEVDADFLVSPGSPVPLVEAMLGTGRLVLPGVLTPTEVMQAQGLGISAMKLFPAQRVGPTGLGALRGPFPDVAFVPTGGIAPADIGTWLDAGALAVGVGGSLAPSTLSTDEDATRLAAQIGTVLGDLAARRDRISARGC